MPLTPAAVARPLPPIAAHVDEVLARLDAKVDWLLALSPIDGASLWRDFDAAGRSVEPALRYVDLESDLPAVQAELDALPIADIEAPALQALLGEKQRELDRMIRLVHLRDTDAFIEASIALFGDVDDALLALATETLDTVTRAARSRTRSRGTAPRRRISTSTSSSIPTSARC